METTIALPENLTIHQIDAQFGGLKLAFESDADVYKIDGSEVESVDTAGLQSLLVLMREAEKRNKTIEWSNSTETLQNAAAKIGLIEQLNLPHPQAQAS